MGLQNAVFDQPESRIPAAGLLAFYTYKNVLWQCKFHATEWLLLKKMICVECRRQDSYFCSFTHWFTLVTTSSLSLWSRELSLRASPKHCRRTSASHTAVLYFWLTASICESKASTCTGRDTWTQKHSRIIEMRLDTAADLSCFSSVVVSERGHVHLKCEHFLVSGLQGRHLLLCPLLWACQLGVQLRQSPLTHPAWRDRNQS